MTLYPRSILALAATVAAEIRGHACPWWRRAQSADGGPSSTRPLRHGDRRMNPELPATVLDRHPEYADVDAVGIHLLCGEVAGA